MSVEKVKKDGRDGYSYKTANGDVFFSYSDIQDMEELAEALEAITNIDDDDDQAAEFIEHLQRSIDAYSAEHRITIRDIIGKFCGKTIADITQHDDEEYLEGADPYILLMFTDGCTLKLFCSGLVAYDSNKNSTTSFYLAEDEDEDDYEAN